MGFCEHCQGQRFDRARILRRLRQQIRDARDKRKVAAALVAALEAVRSLDIPHLEVDDEPAEQVVH